MKRKPAESDITVMFESWLSAFFSDVELPIKYVLSLFSKYERIAHAKSATKTFPSVVCSLCVLIRLQSMSHLF